MEYALCTAVVRVAFRSARSSERSTWKMSKWSDFNSMSREDRQAFRELAAELKSRDLGHKLKVWLSKLPVGQYGGMDQPTFDDWLVYHFENQGRRFLAQVGDEILRKGDAELVLREWLMEHRFGALFFDSKQTLESTPKPVQEAAPEPARLGQFLRNAASEPNIKLLYDLLYQEAMRVIEYAPELQALMMRGCQWLQLHIAAHVLPGLRQRDAETAFYIGEQRSAELLQLARRCTEALPLDEWLGAPLEQILNLSTADGKMLAAKVYLALKQSQFADTMLGIPSVQLVAALRNAAEAQPALKPWLLEQLPQRTTALGLGWTERQLASATRQWDQLQLEKEAARLFE